MTDYTDLVRALREDQVNLTPEQMDAAADAIDFLLGEIDAHAELCPLMGGSMKG